MTSDTNPWVWAKDDEGRRRLCPMDCLSDPNYVSSQEFDCCIDDDSRLETREYVPSNDPSGKINFAQSASPN